MSKPIGYYRLLHGAQITVTIPAGVTAWKYVQREELTMTVNHPQESTYRIFEDRERIQADWFDGQGIVLLDIRVEWIVGRERILEDEKVIVEFRLAIPGSQMASRQWLRDSEHDPERWQVYRGKTLLGDWDPVNRGETVVLKLKPVG